MGKNAATPAATGGRFTIGFGLANVPVAFRPLIEPKKEVSGRTLCPEHMLPISQVSKCSEGTDHEHILGHGETVIGYQDPDDPNRFVVVDSDVLKELKQERTGRLELRAVAPINDIDPLYFSKTYLIWPQDGGERAFDLLANVLRSDNLAAIGSVVLTKQTVNVVVRWSETTKTLLAHVCEFAERVRWGDVTLVRDAMENRQDPDKQELSLAKQVIGTLPKEFKADEVEDTYMPMLKDAIKAAAGKLTIKRGEKKPAAAPPGDLLEALKASLDAHNKKGKGNGKVKVERGGVVVPEKSRVPRVKK